MLEIVLRLVAVVSTAILLLVFGWYFSFGSDTLQHDWIFFGGGVLALLSGLATLPFIGMIFMQIREYGVDGIASDVGYPEMAGPPPNVGGAAARAAAAAAADDSESDSEE
jgi:hypothetical protein